MKKHKRALSLLLIICIMCCAVFGSVEFSNALVLNPWTIALCGTLLCAAGLTFDSTQQMESAVGSFVGSCDASLLDWLVAESESFKEEYGSGFHFPITEALVSAISGWLSGLTASDGGSVSVDSYVSYSTSDFTKGQVLGTYPVSKFFDYSDSSSFDELDLSRYFMLDDIIGFRFVHFNSWDSSMDNKYCLYCIKKLSDGSYSCGRLSQIPTILNSYFADICVSSITTDYFYLTVRVYDPDLGSENSFVSQGNTIKFSECSTLSVPQGISIPFDSTWAPGSEDESKALVPGASVKLPKGLVQDGALDSDVVGTMTPESVRAGTSDIPDVIAGTGTITGTGEGTGIFEGIGSLVLDIPIIGTIASTLSEILEAIKGFFDVSRFDLNFESLKVGLTGVFPFCIPFDFFNAVKMFSSDASSFVFDINLETEYFTIDHTVDLTPFRLPILFFRYVVVFWFGFILISRTKDFMKW